MPGVVTPRTIAIARDILAGPDGIASVAEQQFTFPLLLRSPGYHTGRNFIFVEKASELSAAAAGLPGNDLLVIEYLDARGEDGNARKYRVMMIGGQIYPLHLAISRQWKVHYFTSDMADKPDHRSEEASFLGDMRGALGDKAITASVKASREGISSRQIDANHNFNSSHALTAFVKMPGSSHGSDVYSSWSVSFLHLHLKLTSCV